MALADWFGIGVGTACVASYLGIAEDFASMRVLAYNSRSLGVVEACLVVVCLVGVCLIGPALVDLFGYQYSCFAHLDLRRKIVGCYLSRFDVEYACVPLVLSFRFENR